jgi:acyl-coenzyme A synthetase/AMP-(fatty) acid ligase
MITHRASNGAGARLPFLRPGQPEDTIAWRGKRPITRREFLRDLAVLTARLPDRSHVLNHCEDRYQFLVGLAAALTRGQVSLFPSNRAPEVLAQLTRDYPDMYCLTDQRTPEEAAVMELCTYDTSGTFAEAQDPAFPAEQLVAIAFTSGSTGVPKPYPKYWGGIVHEARIAGERLGLDARRAGPEPKCRDAQGRARAAGGQILATVPAQHMYGFVYSVILPAQWGYVIGAERPFYPEDIRRSLAALPGPAILVTTPVHIRACVLDGVRFPPLDFILTSTAPLDAQLAAQAEALYDTRVQEFYGSTETGAIASRRQTDSALWRTFDGVRVAAVDNGFRVEAPYLPEPMVLADHVDVRNEREFLLYGRNADLIKIAGKRVTLGDLNHQLLAIEGVVDGTFLMPDAENGREPRLAAFVVAPGHRREEILESLRSRIDPVFLPRPLRLVEALPRNATGKLPRGNLLRLLQETGEKEATE